MLVLDGLTYRAGATTILNDLSLTVPDACIVSLLGPSGSGKTSVLRTVMGLNVPQSGSCRFADQDLTINGIAVVPPPKRPFAYLFQNFTLFPHLGVRKNISIGMASLPKSEQKERIERVTTLLGIEHLLKRSIHDLSGGEQQRVALARTLCLSPRVLLLDEPFSNLDKHTRIELYADVKALIRDAGMSAILATHDQDEAFFFSDQMAVLRDGCVVANGTPQALYRDPQTEWLARFTGRVTIVSGAELRAWFGCDGSDEQRYAVRPEQVTVRSVDQSATVVADISPYGSYTMVTISNEHSTTIEAAVLGMCELAIGQSVALQLLSDPAEVTT